MHAASAAPIAAFAETCHAGACYNAEKPEFGADWTMRLQFTLLFPK